MNKTEIMDQVKFLGDVDTCLKGLAENKEITAFRARLNSGMKSLGHDETYKTLLRYRTDGLTPMQAATTLCNMFQLL